MALKEKKESNGTRRLETVVNVPELCSMTGENNNTMNDRFDRGEFGPAALKTKTGDRLIDLSKFDFSNYELTIK